VFLIYWKFYDTLKKYLQKIKAQDKARKKPDYSLTKKLNP